ncbi:nucleosidase [Streptomyces sp. NBRC 110611]|uniref:futalosine hydrolase n=1 Tax=Streptomyces sp. NBRC 110611 TaxID=1621259 RepID=UPI000855E4A1|nr:futalosine hydrolase [Streptomyces sp. NBRC 110611]GAU64817.1 nucleosidase [Streptomyces sp. NBRC 110611]
MRILVVTAVAAERDAVAAALDGGEPDPLPGGYELLRCAGDSEDGEDEPVAVTSDEAVAVASFDVLAAGVGPAAAAAGTATALTAAALSGQPYDLAVSAGIGGGFAPGLSAAPPGSSPSGAPLGSVVVAEAIVAADLGAETPDGFAPVTELGFGTVVHRPDPALVRAVATAAGAAIGTIITVSTVTGSAERAAELAERHPGVLAEAMEGFGVAEAAAAHGVPVLEVRAISNAVGPRDRAAWRIGDALAALTGAFRTLRTVRPLRPLRPLRALPEDLTTAAAAPLNTTGPADGPDTAYPTAVPGTASPADGPAAPGSAPSHP